MSTSRLVAALLAFCTLVVVARVGASGMGEYRRAEQFRETGALHEAAVHYGRAIHLYLPLSTLPHKAAERLLERARAAQAAGDMEEARFCYEELRSGFLAVRSFYQPGKSTIAHAETELAAIMLADQRGNWPDRSLPVSEREALIRAALETREDPKLLWVLVMALGYLLWLGGAATAIWKGLPMHGDQGVLWQPIRRFGGASLVGYLLWLLGVALA